MHAVIPLVSTSVSNCGVLACVAFLGVVVAQCRIALVILALLQQLIKAQGFTL